MQKSEFKEKRFWAEKAVLIGILLLLPNSGYLIAFAENSFFYMLNVFLHVGLGLALLVPALIYGRRLLAKDARTGKELAMFTGHLGFWFCVLGVAAALYLMLAGNFKKSEWILYAHVVFCFLGVIFLTTAIRRVGHQISIKNRYDTAGRWLLIFSVVGVCIPLLVHAYRFLFVHYDERIHNPALAPASMEAEAIGGTQGPFFPSSAATTSQDTIPVSFLVNAEACGAAGCHEDIYRQWRSSSHRFAGFENPWYRAALAETEAQAGTTATKWCAGCHTPAALLNGVSNLAVAAQTQTEVAQAGVTCTACHTVVDVRGTMGQGGYVIEKPAMFAWLASEDAWKRRLFAWFVRLDSKPHRQAFLQPFHQKENGAFCSSCHKGHVDWPLNHARWVQVMNDYDSWQASGFGLGAKDYARTPARKDCAACHMAAPSGEANTGASRLSDHRFLGANAWLPLWQNDRERLQATLDYLRENRITLDIFAASVSPNPRRKPQLLPPDSSSIYRQEALAASVMQNAEAEWSLQRIALAGQEPDSLIAPLADHLPFFSAGQSFRLDVVVRSRDIGHYFPAGAADMAQAWLEVQIFDERGKTVFWSGAARGERREEVDPRAHFYGVHLLDGAGRRVYHAESWKTQSAFANLLPPNSAEVVRYRVKLPEDCGSQLRLVAKLNYRQYHPEALARLQDHDAGLSAAMADTARHALRKQIVPPVVELARTELALSSRQRPKPEEAQPDKTVLAARWQDYGIGLLRQHDVAAAEQAFLSARALAPKDIDTWINLGIIKLRLGQAGAAKKLFDKALELDEEDPRAHFYMAMAFKAEGDYRQALKHVKSASSVARRDREFHMELGRLHHLLGNRRYSKQAYKRVTHIDPEDPAIYEELIQVYKAEGNKEARMARSQQLAHRFAQDERMKSLARQARMQAFRPDTASTVYHEYHSADPNFWPATEPSNGHVVSTAKR